MLRGDRGSRRRGWAVLLLAVGLVTAFALIAAWAIAGAIRGGDDAAASPDASASGGPGASASPPVALDLVERQGEWYAAAPLDARDDETRAAVSRVIDGDTVDVLAAQEQLRVRFFGIDTPERGEACFPEASARTTELVGREVLLVPDARPRDRSGRELRYVFGIDGRSIDATLIAEGLARAWRDDGALRDRLVAIEEEARHAKRGCLWR